MYVLNCKCLSYSSFHNLVLNQYVCIIKPCGKNLHSVCLHFALISLVLLNYIKAFMFFKGVYTDHWMVPWVVVRKVFLAHYCSPNLIVSLVTTVNEIINQQHAATKNGGQQDCKCNCDSITSSPWSPTDQNQV